MPLNCWVSAEGLSPVLFHSTTSTLAGSYNLGVGETVTRKWVLVNAVS